MQILDGKSLSGKLKDDIIAASSSYKRVPILAVITIGDNSSSEVYVRNKKKACEYVGIRSVEYTLPEETTEDELLSLIDVLNNLKCINGILIQLPLPKHIDESKVLERIVPEKDVDGFTAINTGKLWQGEYTLAPCTAMGIIELLDYYNIEIAGKHCVIVGRSNIVGKPLAALLLERNATVTVCHSRTRDLAEVTRRADILVVAIGKADFVTGDMVKDGVVVIDVGMNRKADGKLTGDVDYASVEPKASYITPVPGGVGPMTITMLLRNTLTAAKKQSK
jgi:methylenetetrahydrofolate dehydrogenase (NADP+)/methenyltetrahydrofolate cyclohydrolase